MLIVNTFLLYGVTSLKVYRLQKQAKYGDNIKKSYHTEDLDLFRKRHN